jgi:hypothetical protein
VPGREAEAAAWPEITIRFVSEEYFETLSLPVVRGRAVNASDDSKAPLVVAINQAAADLAFNGRDPVGQMIGFWGDARRIVGVVGDERMHGVTEKAPPAVYLPLTQAPVSSVVLVRTSGDPMALSNDVRAAIAGVDPQLALYGVESLETTLSASVGQRKFTMLIVSAFGALAIVLALIGVHGMLSYTASQRTREFGIRLALGATRGNVQRVVVGGGLRLAALGVALGVGGALWATRWIGTLLYGVLATDARSYVSVIAFVLVAAAAACWLPAVRATRTQALEALRAE